MEEKEKEDEPNLLYELLYYVMYNSHEPVNVARQALLLLHRSLAIFRGEIYHINEYQQLELLATTGYEAVNTTAYEGWEKQHLEQQLIRNVLQDGKGVTIPDVGCQNLWVPFTDVDAEICSIAAFPLMVAAKTRGVMMLLSDEPDYFSEERVPFLTAVAASIALTLENAYLFAQAWQDEHQLHLWAAQLITAQNVERRNLSYILHEETGESLTMLQMHLTALKNDLSVRSPGRAAATQAQQILGEIMLRLNQLAYALRPPELDILGLNAALATLCQEFTPHDGLSIRYSGVEKLPTLTEMAGVSFYYCLQEALTNVDRHAQASEVDVNLSYDQHFVYLQVKDNGIGLETAKNTAVKSGIGLTDIKERFENIRGFMKIKSHPGRGTTLTVGIPRLDTI